MSYNNYELFGENRMVSFIISVDNSYELMDNFIYHFFKSNFVIDNQSVFVIDANYDLRIHKLLKDAQKKYSNIKIIFSDTKLGYGRANNLAVSKCDGEYLFFINTDVFAENDCFEKMFDILKNNRADCVQPLLIWPQNKLVQCAGSTFGPYFKNHLYAGRRADHPCVLKSGPRQALTSALYAMKKTTFYDMGQFDAFYYNKLESFELSLKISIAGGLCWYASEAKAYHAQGCSRNMYSFDFRQQEARFWCYFGDKYIIDINEYFNKQILPPMLGKQYDVICFSQVQSWKSILEQLPLKYQGYYDYQGIDANKINLIDLVPSYILYANNPLIFLVDNINDLKKNKLYIQQSKQTGNIVLDTYGNLVDFDELQ